ncbi:MAG: hypothetical protein ACRDFS_01620 [Chloroflexota bacterium]
MSLYRQIQEAQRRMTDLEEQLRSGILATEIRDMAAYAGNAHAIAEDVKYDLDAALNEGEIGEQSEQQFVQAALDSTRDAILAAQKVALGTTIDEVRAWMLDFKTHADYADAYLHAALGHQME